MRNIRFCPLYDYLQPTSVSDLTSRAYLTRLAQLHVEEMAESRIAWSRIIHIAISIPIRLPCPSFSTHNSVYPSLWSSLTQRRLLLLGSLLGEIGSAPYF